VAVPARFRARRGVRPRDGDAPDLAEYIGITEANLSLLKHGKVKGVRFDTLQRICEFLDCQPGDVLVHVPDPAPKR